MGVVCLGYQAFEDGSMADLGQMVHNIMVRVSCCDHGK